MVEAPETVSRESWRRRQAVEFGMVALALSSVAVILVDLVVPDLTVARKNVLLAADFAICVVFWVDFGFRLRRETRKASYFGRRWYELVGMLPAAVFALLEAQSSLGVIARTFRLIGAAARLTRFASTSRSLFARMHLVPFGIVVMAVVLISGTLAYEFERDAEGGNIKNVADGIWYALATVTTVGYGDRFPVTAAGRAVGAFTMLAGITLFGTLIALMGAALATRWGRAFAAEDPELALIQRRLAEAKDLTEEEARALAKRVEDYCRTRSQKGQ
ncbi:MAG: ion channel [Halobacteria archaeon]